MTPADAMAILEQHMAAEGALDLDAAVATTAPDVAYEFPLQGKRFSGRDSARRFYESGAEHRFRVSAADGQGVLPTGEMRARWDAGGTVIIEAASYPVMLEDGAVEAHPVAAVLAAGPEGVRYERIYVSDRMFELLIAHVRDLLEDM